MKYMEMRKWRALWISIFLAVLGMPCLALTQTAPQAIGERPAERLDDGWGFLFYLPGWVPAMSGSAGVGDASVDIDIDQIQAWENLKYLSQMPLTGHLEVKKGPFSLLLDGLFAKYELDQDGGRQLDIPVFVPIHLARLGRTALIDRLIRGDFRGEITVTAAYSVDEASLLYDVYRSSTRVGGEPTLTVQALAGFRYTYLQTKVDGNARLTLSTPRGPVTRTLVLDKTGTEDWFDPIVGGRVFWNLSDHWMLGFHADFGGFTLVSDFQTNLNAWMTYRINHWLFVNGGYRALYDNYESGSGEDRFEYDLWAYGPWLGIGVRF